jgi:predicted RNA-binding protein YlqC (UPF0109 family)
VVADETKTYPLDETMAEALADLSTLLCGQPLDDDDPFKTVKVSYTRLENSVTFLITPVDPKNTGMVMGKNGKTINSLCSLAWKIGRAHGSHYDVDIHHEGGEKKR